MVFINSETVVEWVIPLLCLLCVCLLLMWNIAARDARQNIECVCWKLAKWCFMVHKVQSYAQFVVCEWNTVFRWLPRSFSQTWQGKNMFYGAGGLHQQFIEWRLKNKYFFKYDMGGYYKSEQPSKQGYR